MSTKHVAGRRGFIKRTAAMTAGLAGLGMLSEVEAATPDSGVNILGPKPRYSPQIGTMVSDLRGYTPETGLSVKRLLTSPISEANLYFVHSDASDQTVSAVLVGRH
jgi:hypothetical protein